MIDVDGGVEQQFRCGSSGLRPRITIRTKDPVIAKERIIRMRAAVARLVKAKRYREAVAALEQMGAATNQRDFAGAEAAARKMAETVAEPAAAPVAVTFRDINEMWLSGVLHERHAIEHKGEDSVANTRGLMNLILPILGNLPVASITVEDCDKVKTAVNAKRKRNGEKLKLGQKKKYTRAVRQVLGFAVEPLRLIKVVPVSEDWCFKGQDEKKAFQMIYPREDAKLMRCGEVDIMDRFYLAMLWRYALRPGECARLRWRHLSFVDDGLVKLNIDKTKTRRARSFHLDDDAIAVFVALRPADAQLNDLVFPHAFSVLKRVVQEVLHPALQVAGIDKDRPELFENTDERRHIVAHDGRATYITLKGGLGATELEIMRVSGHETSKEIRTYTREMGELAEQVKKGRLTWFEPLDLLFGLRAEPTPRAGEVAREVARVIPIHGKKPATRSSARTSEHGFSPSEVAETPQKGTSSDGNRGAVPPVNGGVAQPDGSAIAGLTAGIANASAASKWALVERLTTQLERLTAGADAAAL